MAWGAVASDKALMKYQAKENRDGSPVDNGRRWPAIGSKHGQTTKVAVDAQTGRLRAEDEDEDQ